MKGSDFCGEVGKLGDLGRGLRSGSEPDFGGRNFGKTKTRDFEKVRFRESK